MKSMNMMRDRCGVCLRVLLIALSASGGVDAHAADVPNVPPSPAVSIDLAGRAESDKERYRILKDLRDRGDLSEVRRRELDALLPAIDWWANGRAKSAARKRFPSGGQEACWLNEFFLGNLDRFHVLNGDWPGKVAADSPLRPLWAFYRARALIWTHIEWGGNADERERFYSTARQLIEVAARAHPDNPVIGMYNGKPIPWKSGSQPDPNAPEWANLQREGLEKLTEVIHWWIDERQNPDGQYGGGWGDDVEMWRWWAPILVAFDDPKIAAAQARLSEAVLGQPHMAKGYSASMSDVEHSAEDTGDTITPMLFLDADSPKWRGRALRVVELARESWLGRNQRGFLQFKSTFFDPDRVDTDARRACDTVYHPRVFQPALLHWQRSGDKQVGEVITRWMDTWVDAAARAENGKPAGIVPSAIHWPDGRVGGGVESWWKPQNDTTSLYEWPSAMPAMLCTLLLTHHMTGDRKYLEPIRSMAGIRLKHLPASSGPESKPGSEAWCASKMGTFLPLVLGKYRLLTGDPSFDAVLHADGDGYLRMRLGRGRDALLANLRDNAAAFRINKPACTGEVRYTDRVLRFNERWGQWGLGRDWPAPRPEMLYACVTGDPGWPFYFPMTAVRWLTEPRAFAALVTDSGRDRFAAELYHFGPEPRKMAAELCLLKPGPYRLELLSGGKPVKPAEDVVVTGMRTRVAFEVPPRVLCLLRVQSRP